MATATLTPAPAPRPQTRITVEEYRRLVATGVIPENGRIELIRGVLVERSTINPPHATSISRLRKQITRFEEQSVLVRIEAPIALSPDSGPVPDFAVVKGSEDDCEARHPGLEDIYLVIEVSDSSLAVDQTIKLQLYAEAKLPEYWIVNIPDRRVEVYTIPNSDDVSSYLHRQDYQSNEEVPVVVAEQMLVTIPVHEILPKS